VGTSRLPNIAPRREMVLMLMLGVAGAGLVFLAGRQGWAHVRTAAPRPLPGSDIPVTGQDLVPAAAALAVAALASLAAVLATRGLARRLVGLVLAGFGAGLAVAVSLRVTAADAIAAVSGAAGAPGTAGSGTAGSVTAGGPGGAGQAGAPPIAGFPAHVVMTSLLWRALALGGAAAIVLAGLIVVWRASRWPVMSSRYDAPGRTVPRPAAPAARQADVGPPAAPGSRPAAPGPPSAALAAPAAASGPPPAGLAAGPALAAGDAATSAAGDTATIWESLSRGEDPTDGHRG
jgi:uncharacterized membrane protein (TIGR02234 family)